MLTLSGGRRLALASATALVSCALLPSLGFGLQTTAISTTAAPVAVAPKAQLHGLLICNAFPHDLPLEIFAASEPRNLTASGPLAFKECREFPRRLREGDRIQFRFGALSVGAFAASGLPQVSGASLLVIPTRRNTTSLVAAFRTHMFADLESPQVVLMDTYQGPEELGKVSIIDRQRPESEEELGFDSALAMNPGKYRIGLSHADTERQISSSSFQAFPRSKHVVLRVGGSLGTDGSRALPQELLLFSPRGQGAEASEAGPGSKVLSALASAIGFGQVV